MEPVTHALASLTLARAGRGRWTRMAAPMLLAAGLAADLDWISYAAGAPAFLAWRRTASHSLLGAAAIAVAVAASFWLWDRRQRGQSQPLRFLPALAACAAGAALHLLLDLCNSDGVQLLWPFRARRFAWDLAPSVDPGLLVILLAGLLLPGLLNLVSEEIGARANQRPGALGAAIALALAVLYMGGRTIEHQRADAILNAHAYGDEAPIRAAAFPTFSPLLWRGVVETQTALHEVQVPLSPGSQFDARAARTQFKPENSPALERAVASDAARALLTVARFPLARAEPTENGVEIRIRDLREAASPADPTNVIAEVTVNARGEVTHSGLRFETDSAR